MSPAARLQSSVLTPRERQVAALIAEGMSNREIAAELGFAERTAGSHVQNILNKLGLDNRVQIATWWAHEGAGDWPRRRSDVDVSKPPAGAGIWASRLILKPGGVARIEPVTPGLPRYFGQTRISVGRNSFVNFWFGLTQGRP